MPTARTLQIPPGLHLPARFEFSGASPYSGTDPVPFALDWMGAGGELLFHFNPRPESGTVVLNSRLGGAWGEETVVKRYPFPLDPGHPYRLTFDILPDRFEVFVDGDFLCEFPRAESGTVKELRSTIFLWRLEPDRSAHGPSADSRTDRSESSWVAARRKPHPPDPLPSFRLFSVLCTWMEEDVVEATVANCLRQGCERVYLVDNASPDRTVARACAAGALLARRFETERYDEEERIRQMQAVVDEVSSAEGDEHVWWLWLDADEFHHGPSGMTVREYLSSLDRCFRVVGARFLDHFPSGAPAYESGRHPLDFQPLCFETAVPNCGLGHRKHPLQRWDRDGPSIHSGLGFHAAESSTLLLEPTLPVFCHHFPNREEAVTRRRLARLFGADDSGVDRIRSDPNHAHLRSRLRSLAAVYGQRWEEVSFFPPCVEGYVPELRPWEAWVKPADRTVARWY